ncbi:MAG: response regulator [Flavobacteriales bacterium]|nr:response regulator [Flavobacteriales bacterium]MCB9167950.1 response regulator [Flavobacteriales bacterium]
MPEAQHHGRSVLVVEDEAIIRKDIVHRLEQLGYRVIGTARSGSEAIVVARSLLPDVVIMDIHLTDGHTGIDAARAIHRELHRPVVFLTANSDEATVMSARTAEPYGFLVKPFNDAALRAAMEIAMYKHVRDRGLIEERRHLFQLASERVREDSIFVKHKGVLIRCPIEGIVHLEALRDYVGIHLADRRFVVHATLQTLAGRLPRKDFMRVHRSFIVRIERIQVVHEGIIVLEPNGARIPIGGTYQAAVRERLKIL